MLATKRTFIGIIFISILVGGCRNSFKPAEIGRLSISSDTTGADIYLNDRLQAIKTNASFDLKPGKYRIKLTKNTTGPGDPLIGEAIVDVVAGRSAGVAIGLNTMNIIPAATVDVLRPETQAQKAILDYYATLQAKDLRKAFAYFSRHAQLAQGGFRYFSKTGAKISSIEVTSIKTESSDTSNSIEVNRVGIETTKIAGKEPTPQTVQSEVLITTRDELPGLGLPKIESIVDASATL